MRQTTIGHRVTCNGVGLHTGRDVTLTLAPAAAGTGVVFRRTDLGDGRADSTITRVPALFDRVVDTRLGTTVANEHGVSVATIEHLMAALAGLGIDNVEVELSGPEVPIMDGSAAPFVFLIECAGTRALSARRQVLRILEPVMVEENGRRAALLPSDAFELDIAIDFPSAAVRRQRCSVTLEDPGAFKAQVSRARTFGFLQEVEFLRRNGLALGGSLENAIVIDGDVVLNAEGLRFGDEFARHKVLDAVGDLALAGAPIRGAFRGDCSGHGLNNHLLRALFAREEAYVFEAEEVFEARGRAASAPRSATL